MQFGPLRKCQRATHFKNLDAKHLVPCSPSDPGAMEMKISQIEHPEMLVAPVVTFEDFILSLQKMKPTVSKEDLKRQEDFMLHPVFRRQSRCWRSSRRSWMRTETF